MEIEELLTKKDLEAFRQSLLREIAEMVTNGKAEQRKPYLKSKEVRQLMGISYNTLQALRVKKLLCPCAKVEGIYYYKYTDVERLLNANAEQ